MVDLISLLMTIYDNVEIAAVITYTQANISADPNFYGFVAEEAVKRGATVVIGCDSTVSE